jgi:hypothetical protein
MSGSEAVGISCLTVACFFLNFIEPHPSHE